MATVIPQSELVKRAAVFIKDELAEHPEKSLSALMDEASMRFNLSPLEADALFRLFRKEETEPS